MFWTTSKVLWFGKTVPDMATLAQLAWERKELELVFEVDRL